MISRPYASVNQSYYQHAKRAYDFTFCLLMLPFLAVIAAITALAIYFDSPGSVLLKQERIGKDGRSFRLYKFRTMPEDVDVEAHKAFMKRFVRGELITSGDKAIYKPFSSEQVTRVGKILRKTSLDEFPQIINILKGDMSLVGPRPNVPWEVDEYKEWHRRRLEVRPGITGLAQIRGRSGILFDEIVRHDIEYIENQNPLLDLKIMLFTVTSVFMRRGAL